MKPYKEKQIIVVDQNQRTQIQQYFQQSPDLTLRNESYSRDSSSINMYKMGSRIQRRRLKQINKNGIISIPKSQVGKIDEQKVIEFNQRQQNNSELFKQKEQDIKPIRLKNINYQVKEKLQKQISKDVTNKQYYLSRKSYQAFGFRNIQNLIKEFVPQDKRQNTVMQDTTNQISQNTSKKSLISKVRISQSLQKNEQGTDSQNKLRQSFNILSETSLFQQLNNNNTQSRTQQVSPKHYNILYSNKKPLFTQTRLNSLKTHNDYMQIQSPQIKQIIQTSRDKSSVLQDQQLVRISHKKSKSHLSYNIPDLKQSFQVNDKQEYLREVFRAQNQRQDIQQKLKLISLNANHMTSQKINIKTEIEQQYEKYLTNSIQKLKNIGNQGQSNQINLIY